MIQRNGRQQFQGNRQADFAAAAPVSNDDRGSMTRADLTEVVFRRLGLSRNESGQLLEMFLGEIGDALSRGESVKLSGFGTFLARSKKERVGRNPKTGAAAKIGARKVLSFKPSEMLRQRVDGDEILDSKIMASGW